MLSDIKSKVKESTLANYNMKLNKHILPYFSGIKYEKLTAEKINAFIDEKINSGLSPKYVADMVVLLKTAAKYAAKCFGCVNRIDSVALPKTNMPKESVMLSDDEQLILKNYIFEHQTASNVCVLLALSTGMRIGEVCGLKCEDVDLKKSIITVRHTVQRIMDTSDGGTKIIVTSPKSRTSVRDIPIPEFLVPIIKNIITADSNYLLSGSNDVTEPRTLQNRFKKLLKSANLTIVKFHSLRHAFATKCVAIGVDVKTLSEILGHSSVEITLNRYVHSSIERKKHCMKMFSDSLSVA
ncbi:MAG: site-specific integrase [Ruminococcus flavefaciens]|nr:site-specific integrase [Ruminococcus flavefaciens]